MLSLRFRSFCLMLFIFLGCALGFAESVESGGFSFDENNTGTVARLKGMLPGVSQSPVVPASVSINGKELEVTLWLEDALAYNADVFAEDALTSLRCEDSDGELTVRGNCIVGWKYLRSIEFPSQLNRLDCDAIRDCPAIEEVTIRATKMVDFESAYVDYKFTIGNKPVLRVAPDLVDEYISRQSDGSKEEKAFLGNFDRIESFDQEPVEVIPAGVHIVLGDLHLNMKDALPGDRITVQAPEGEYIKGINIGDEAQPLDSDTSTQITIPDFDHHLVMAVDLTSNKMSSLVNAMAIEHRVRTVDGGISIDGYDGTMVVVMDLCGRLVARTHRSHITLAPGIYIVFYGSQGHKVMVK